MKHKNGVVRFLADHSALIVCVLFLIAGLAVLDDYGVAVDESLTRGTAVANARHVLGDESAFSYPGLAEAIPHNPTAFSLPLLAAAVALGLEDSRSWLLGNHLLTHLFFLLAGFCCSRLTWRLLRSRPLALVALLLFLLHPRLYAHSFFNPKDLPFLSLFMISLYLIDRAFRRNSLPAFLLLGAAVGLLTNIRFIGLMLLPAVIVMRACDFALTPAAGRWRILSTTGVFTLAALVAWYASWPYLWGDPLGRFLDPYTTIQTGIGNPVDLFEGKYLRGAELPWRYIPAWIAMTTPPLLLMLLPVGIAALLHGGLTRPRDIFRNTPLRLGFLLLACLTLPVLALELVNFAHYNGWRHLYFLHAPICLLAVFGLHGLLKACQGAPVRMGICGLTGLGLAAALGSVISLHPHQQVYFNFLADRKTPEYLRSHYPMDYWGASHLQGLEWLLKRQPEGNLCVRMNLYAFFSVDKMLPQVDQQRIVVMTNEGDECLIDFFIDDPEAIRFPRNMQNLEGHAPELYARKIYARKVYNNTLLSVFGINLAMLDEHIAAPYINAYRAAAAREPAARAHYDLHLDGEKLVYVRESCGASDMSLLFFLRIAPADANDPVHPHPETGNDILDFYFHERGVRFDGKCLLAVPLPSYEIAAIRTGQLHDRRKFLSNQPLEESDIVWDAAISFSQAR